MNFSNSFSSIISSLPVCTRSSISSFSVMSGEGLPPVNPEVAAPTVGVVPGEVLPSQVPVVDEVSLLEVELQSLQTAMLDAAKLREVKGEVTILEDVTESDDPTGLAKQQLKVMTSLHNICAKQFFAHETSLKS